MTSHTSRCIDNSPTTAQGLIKRNGIFKIRGIAGYTRKSRLKEGRLGP